MTTRHQAIRAIMEQVEDEIVVCNIGHPSRELFEIQDRPRNFYMLGSMGLASSIGLGLALSQPERVLVIEGEGSVLMNLGSLATIGSNSPENLALLIIDNESYGSTGFQPTFTANGLSLAAVAKDCGIEDSFAVSSPDEIGGLVDRIRQTGKGPCCAVIRTEKVMDKVPPLISLDAEDIKKRFMEAIRNEP